MACAPRLHIPEAGAAQGSAIPWPAVEAQTVLGGHAMIQEVRTQIKEGRREIVGKRRLKTRSTFQDAISVVEKHRNQSWKDFKDRHGELGREIVWWLARRHTGMTLAQLGQLTGGADYAAVAMALKRLELKAANNPAIKAEMQTLENQILNVKM